MTRKAGISCGTGGKMDNQSFLRKLTKRQRTGILDMALELNDDTRIDVEMQIKPQKYWNKRNLFYLS